MTGINLYQAKTNLSALVERAAAGEEIIIAKAGRPMARLVPLATRAAPRRLGALGGTVHLADDFDAPLPDDLAAGFEGRGGQSRGSQSRGGQSRGGQSRGGQNRGGQGQGG